MRSLVCATFVSLCAVAGGQLVARTQPEPGILHAITVKGNKRYSSAGIAKASELRIGQKVTPEIIRQARQRLQDTELFTTVADHYQFFGQPLKYDVTFTVSENQQVFPIRFERLGVSSDALREYLRTHVEMYSDEIPGTKAVLDRYRDAVKQFVDAKKPGVKIVVTISNENPQQLAAVFAPNTPAPTISQVFVTGNHAIDTGTILRAVNVVAVGTPDTDMRLKLILNGAIRPLYAAKGYAAVSFPKIVTVPSKTDSGVVVKVQIKEGPVFHFGSIHFHGSGLDPNEVRAEIPFRPGQVFNGQKVQDFRVQLLKDLDRRGYLDATISAQTKTDDANRAVHVAYNVTPGSQYNFQSLDIHGLDLTSQPVIERLWGEKFGKPFNPEYPSFFLKRIQDMNLFDHLSSTHSDYTKDASTHGVIVHLYFVGGLSAADRAKKKREQEEKRETDGSWSPW